MKNTILAFGLAGLIAPLAADAFADNTAVEEAIKARTDLSSFYQALVNTGVSHELQPGASYSVFAPTNDAFAKIAPAQYPCFYDAACRLEVAQVLRNHIVPGEVMITDAVKQKGGLYSIDQRFIALGEPVRNQYTVDGKTVTSINQLAGSMLYKIDGVIVSERELAIFQEPVYHYAYLPDAKVTTTTQRTVRRPATCTGPDCPSGVEETTTVTRTSPVIAPIPMMAPAR